MKPAGDQLHRSRSCSPLTTIGSPRRHVSSHASPSASVARIRTGCRRSAFRPTAGCRAVAPRPPPPLLPWPAANLAAAAAAVALASAFSWRRSSALPAAVCVPAEAAAARHSSVITGSETRAITRMSARPWEHGAASGMPPACRHASQHLRHASKPQRAHMRYRCHMVVLHQSHTCRSPSPSHACAGAPPGATTPAPLAFAVTTTTGSPRVRASSSSTSSSKGLARFFSSSCAWLRSCFPVAPSGGAPSR